MLRTDTTVDRSSVRQSWGSDERFLSSTSTHSSSSSGHKESRGLWGRLRKKSSVSFGNRTNSSKISSANHSTSSVSLSSGTSHVANTTPDSGQETSHSDGALTPVNIGPPATFGEKSDTASLINKHLSLGGPSISARHRSISAQVDHPAMRANSLVTRRPGTADPALRVSVDAVRKTGGMPSYSMDLPWGNRPSVDTLCDGDISADSIRRTLGAYTGKSESKSKPLFRTLLSRSQKPVVAAAAAASIVAATNGNATDAAVMGLERISEDEGEDSRNSLAFNGNLGPIEEPTLRQRTRGYSRPTKYTPARSIPIAHADTVPASKRFSENSGSTVFSSETLASSTADHGRPSDPQSFWPKGDRRSITSVTQQQLPPPLETVSRQRSRGHHQHTRSGLESYSNRLPSPTRENPPNLIPMVHGRVSATMQNGQPIDNDMMLDPVVFRNTFFNARTASDTDNLKRKLKSRVSALRRVPSEETLDGTFESTASKIRFDTALFFVPDYEAADEPADAAAMEDAASPTVPDYDPLPEIAVAVDPKQKHSPMSIAVDQPASQPDDALATSGLQITMQPADDAQVAKLQQELQALKATVSVLQNQNEVLVELVKRDPIDDTPEAVRMHLRTVELENQWLRRELSHARQQRKRADSAC
ncbi:hypothetical protein FBU59_003033 [Linderina macrospora]|uniref:Uncharacterized protein n=1 Tax=Linderina macrospora TaxID=4868 RepID=A0ACC1J9H7_9FUNG|nr:hypothetical protein FBU59_003033 [Linderina macrospora]